MELHTSSQDKSELIFEWALTTGVGTPGCDAAQFIIAKYSPSVWSCFGSRRSSGFIFNFLSNWHFFSFQTYQRAIPTVKPVAGTLPLTQR